MVADERIVRAVAYINAHLSAPLTLDDVARVGVDLADVTQAAERVAPYITADGRRLWSVKLIERAIDPNAPAWLRRRSGAPPKTPPTLAG